jgi:hypothetical protein
VNPGRFKEAVAVGELERDRDCAGDQGPQFVAVGVDLTVVGASPVITVPRE